MAALRRRIACAAVAWSAFAACAAGGQSLPDMLRAEHPELSVAGDGAMRFIGFKVYDIRLWAPGGKFRPDEPYALELVYAMNFKGADIASRSVDEMRGQGRGPEEKLQRWGARMARIFPDVKPGDTLIGLLIPGVGARFYSRDRLIDTVADPEFGAAFFDIWLSEKTSAPDVRKKLLERR